MAKEPLINYLNFQWSRNKNYEFLTEAKIRNEKFANFKARDHEKNMQHRNNEVVTCVFSGASRKKRQREKKKQKKHKMWVIVLLEFLRMKSSPRKWDVIIIIIRRVKILAYRAAKRLFHCGCDDANAALKVDRQNFSSSSSPPLFKWLDKFRLVVKIICFNSLAARRVHVSMKHYTLHGNVIITLTHGSVSNCV